jgi:hypothetical protein
VFPRRNRQGLPKLLLEFVMDISSVDGGIRCANCCDSTGFALIAAFVGFAALELPPRAIRSNTLRGVLGLAFM